VKEVRDLLVLIRCRSHQTGVEIIRGAGCQSRPIAAGDRGWIGMEIVGEIANRFLLAAIHLDRFYVPSNVVRGEVVDRASRSDGVGISSYPAHIATCRRNRI